MDDHRAFYSSAPSVTTAGSDLKASRAAETIENASRHDDEIRILKRDEPESYDSSSADAAVAGQPSGGGEGQEEKLMYQLQRTAGIPLTKTQSRSSTGDASDVADGRCHAVMRKESDHRLERTCTKPPIEDGFYCPEREQFLWH